MRTINSIGIHATATPPSMDVDVAEVRRWHVEERGWSDVGYHFLIRRDGGREEGRPIERPGAHVAGHNDDSIGIALAGGIDEDGEPDANYTKEQWHELYLLVRELTQQFPNAEVKGHRDYPGVTKSCPCFDTVAWWYGE